MKILKNNEGIAVFLNSNIVIPKKIKNLISSVEVGILDGNSQEVSLSAGIQINFCDGSNVLYFPKYCNSGSRSTRSFEEKKSSIEGIFNKALGLAERVIKTFEALAEVPAPNKIEEFIENYYTESKDEGNKKHYVNRLAIENEIININVITNTNSTAGAFAGLFSYLYKVGEYKNSHINNMLIGKYKYLIKNIFENILDK